MRVVRGLIGDVCCALCGVGCVALRGARCSMFVVCRLLRVVYAVLFGVLCVVCCA